VVGIDEKEGLACERAMGLPGEVMHSDDDDDDDDDD
jgi:hypothetical protein